MREYQHKTMFWHAVAGCVFGFLMIGSQLVMAANPGDVATNLSGGSDSVAYAAQIFFSLCGIIMIGVGCFLKSANNKTEGQGAKLSTAITLVLIGGMLFFIASLVQTTGDTVWGTGAGDRSRVTITR